MQMQVLEGFSAISGSIWISSCLRRWVSTLPTRAAAMHLDEWWSVLRNIVERVGN